MITFSKELLTKLRASLLISFKLKNIQAYRLATALIYYGEGRGIKDIADIPHPLFTILYYFYCYIFQQVNFFLYFMLTAVFSYFSLILTENR